MSLQEDQKRRLSRMFLICRRLESRRAEERITRQSLASECDCTIKTIQRDFDFLREAGVPLEYDPTCRSYVLTGPLPFREVRLSLAQMMALVAAREVLLSQADPPFLAAARQAFEKITDLLPGSLRDALQESQQVALVAPSLRRRYGTAPWDELWQATRDHETVAMLYHSLSSNKVAWRQVNPYRLVQLGGYWNLVAYCHTRREVRQFALDSIRQLRLTGETFSLPDDFDLDAYLQGMVGVLRGEPVQIVVRFAPSVARWAERRRWSFPFTLKTEPDGALLLRGEVSGLDEIKTELLSWGAGVEVLEPPELRAALATEAAAIAEKYRT